jgi:opacity protein-like surface antigen
VITKRGALLAALLAPALAAAGSPRSALELGALAGYEGTSMSGFSLRLDAVVPVRELDRRVTLSVVGSAIYSRLTDTAGFVEVAADAYQLVPAARGTLALGERWAVFGDAGAGLAHVRARLTSRSAVFPRRSSSASTLAPMLRLGAGVSYRASERLQVGAIVELDPILGDLGYAGGPRRNTVILLGGAMVRL